MEQKVNIYRFIHDEGQIQRFARLIGEGTHVIYLSVRPKYCTPEEKRVRNRHFDLKVFDNDTDQSVLKQIRRYQVETGTYAAPLHTMVMYCTTNPRDQRKAAAKLMESLVRHAFGSQQFNLVRMAESAVHATKGKTYWITWDIDDKDAYPEMREALREVDAPRHVVETHGGYHVMVAPGPHIAKLVKQFPQHHVGDIACPVPGTFQGGFPVRFVDENE